MLTADLAQSWQRGHRVGPRLVDTNDRAALQTAGELIEIISAHKERSRAELEDALQQYAGTGTDYKTLRGLAKLLTDRCTFETRSVVEPVELRRRVFLRARAYHPVTELTKLTESVKLTAEAQDRIEQGGARIHLRQQIIADVAAELGCSPEEVANDLYADLSANERMIDFEELSDQELLERYNLAQAQALLYRSVEMQLWVQPQEAEEARQLFHAIKTYRLIHSIAGDAAHGYEVQLTGPVSMFHRSQKYGIQMAVFLPALLACRGWRMRAEIALKTTGHNAFFELDAKQNELRSYYEGAPAAPNSLLERLTAGWHKLGSHWQLEPNTEVIDLGASAFVPDLTARHAGGTDTQKIYIEVFGFWTPRHLKRRLEELAQSGFKLWVLVASEELRCSRESPADLPPNVVICKAALDARSVEAALNEVDAATSSRYI